jgi:hypothetical protein
VVQEPRRGYGAACLRGLADLARRPEGPPDAVVFLDADYSDHPEELPYLVQPSKKEGMKRTLSQNPP